jgi:hypothetical protein
LLAFAVTLGCSSSAPVAAGAGAAMPRVSSTELRVQSLPRTNSGNVLSMMVRSVSEKVADTKIETYEEAARMLGDPRDEAVVLSQPIFPGRPTRVRLEQQADKRLILYFFFTQPGDNWRVQIAGAPPAEVSVELGENRVERYQVRR